MPSPGTDASCLYLGTVRHRRHAPVAHAFQYRQVQLYLDLDELPALFDRYWLWSARRPTLAWFRRADYHGPPDQPLADAVRDTLAAQLGFRPDGPIRLLTHPRYYGYCFNPVSFYYCYAADGDALTAILAEITNTPWGERHAYALDCRTAPATGREFRRFRFPKRFHVSPFMPMAQHYDWRFRLPGDALTVHMATWQDGARLFDATLNLARRPLTGASLAHALAAYPAMTAKVSAAIYWQALRLWTRGTPFHPHPAKHPAATPTAPRP